MSLEKISAVEITAHRLRSMARDLILEAEALESSLPKARRKAGPIYFKDNQGRKTLIKEIKI